MIIKNILTYIDHTEATQHALSKAVDLAQRWNARIAALYIEKIPIWLSSYGYELGPDARETQRELATNQMNEVKQFVEQLGADTEINWVAKEGEVAKVISKEASFYDLVVLGHPWESELTDSNLVNSVTLTCGRPVLVIPKQSETEMQFENIVVGWDGSREATRAIHDALPLLGAADVVEVITIDTNAKEKRSLHSITEYLRSHDVAACSRAIENHAGSAGKELLQHAYDRSSDLVVMGCYGHSRLRELILGGCTRHMLESSKLPILMSH